MKEIIVSTFDSLAMRQALRQAYKSYQADEVPVGAIIVNKDGKIIARAYNQVEKKETQLAHAELQVLNKVTKKLKRWRLNDCTLYVTLQPCMMCMGAIILSRVSRVVYAAQSPLFGCNLDKQEWFGIYKDSLPIIEYQENEEATKLLKKFFAQQRKMKNDSTSSVR